MTHRIPTRNEIAAQIDAVLERDPDARCIAIRSVAHDAWPEVFSSRSRAFRVHWCESPLMAREALTDAESVGADGLLLLTNLDALDLGADVVARLSRGRVFQIESWEMVRQVFQARAVDSRLDGHSWMAEILLDVMPPGGYPPVPGGFLDLETAWRHVLATTLGLDVAKPDLQTLLGWTLRAEGVRRFAMLADTARDHISQWISDNAGPVGELVMRCVAAGNGLDALPLGLVCGVVFADIPDPAPELAAAAVRLERFTGERRVPADQGRRWADAASWVVRNADRKDIAPYLERADGLLRELHVESHAGLSDVLPSGFDARLVQVAEALTLFLDDARSRAVEQVERAAERALSHDACGAATTRSERVLMALRLSRWLATSPALSSSFETLAMTYAREGAFVDWGRLKLMGGDEIAAMSRAYGLLSDAARERREKLNRVFVEALRAWNSEGSPKGVCVPIEQVLDDVLSPLAQKCPVLLLVVDGLSFPIFRELCGDLERAGWSEAVPANAATAAIGVAALPTVTEISRASLLSGKLASGAANVEKTAFAVHPALVAASKSAGKPIVFHKGDLGDAAGLAEDVREAVGTRDRQVIAVVYNAVDDHLSGSDQLHQRWALDDLRLLNPLLHEARSAGRALVVTADHGHVIDEKTVQRAYSDGDRWRTHAPPLAEDETALEGGRVRAPTGTTKVVCAWSEKLRYSSKKNGYHGGVSPQEVLVPLAVFFPSRLELEGWKPVPPVQPDWWDDTAAPVQPQSTVGTPEPKPKRVKVEGQGELFEAGAAAKSDWVAGLFASPTYQEQKRLAARVALQDNEMRMLLESLDGRGGKLSKGALAQRVGMPLVRLSGFVNAARRILNVDQAEVLMLDESSAMVELNRELLDVQFQLKVR